jgi:hypothetical protein
MFGGVEIRVPEGWSIISRGVPIFGGYDDKTVQLEAEPGRRQRLLIIKGLALFGGVEIIN